jgi:hypothetical protein
MVKRLAVIVLVGAFSNCGLSSSSAQPVADRLQVTAELTVDRQAVSDTWVLPAVKEQISSRPNDAAAAFNPLLAAIVALEKPTTVTLLRPAPDAARLFVTGLPTGEGIGIEPFSVNLKTDSSGHAVTFLTHNRFYLFDSAANPRKVVDYSYIQSAGRPCPSGFRVANCAATLVVRPVPGGPLTPPAYSRVVFVSLGAAEYRVPGLASILPAGPEPEVVTIDAAIRQRLVSGWPSSYDLEYRGGGTWGFPAATPPPSNDPIARPTHRYRTALTEALEAGWESKVAGQLLYRGRILTYDPTRERGMLRVIVDPRRELVIVLGGIGSKILSLPAPRAP